MIFLTIAQLEKLSTQRLLAYKKKLLSVPESSDWGSGWSQINKSTASWKEAYQNVKDILAKREHLEK